MVYTVNCVRMKMHNVRFQTALERKLCLADRTHISLDTGMRGHVIVVVSALLA